MKPKNVIETPFNNSIKTGIWFVIIVTFIAYFNTFQNKYVLDDFGIVTDNSLTEKGINGIPTIFKTGYRSTLNWNDHELYRPIPKAIFAIFWNISPNNPALAHVFLVLLYSITCGFLFYLLFSRLQFSLKFSFIASLLFALHPIHTEVVANIKGLEEVLAFLFLLMGCYFLLNNKQPTTNINLKELLLINLCFLLALFTKESAISYIIVFPLVLYFYSKPTLKVFFKLFISLTIVATIYLIIRWLVLGDNSEIPDITTNYLISIEDPLIRFVNSIYIAGIYLKQLIWPVTLLCEASFRHYNLIQLSDYRFWLILLIFIGAAIYALLKSKSKTKGAFSILFFLATFAPVSNVLLLIGTNYGERLLFVPSLGFCIGLTLIIEHFVKGKIITKPSWLNIGFRNQEIYFLLGVLSLYGIRTCTRNEDWKDPLTLFSVDVETAPESARIQAYYANAVSDLNRLQKLKNEQEIQKDIQKGIAAYEKAIMIYPKFDAAYESLGNLLFKTGDLAKAETCYLKAISIKNKQPYYHNNYGDFLFQQQRYHEAKIRFENALIILPGFAKALNNLGSIYGIIGKTYLTKAENFKLINDTIGMNSQIKIANLTFDTAITYYDKAIEADPYFFEPLHYKAITCQLKGDFNMANIMETKAEELKASLSKRNK